MAKAKKKNKRLFTNAPLRYDAYKHKKETWKTIPNTDNYCRKFQVSSEGQVRLFIHQDRVRRKTRKWRIQKKYNGYKRWWRKCRGNITYKKNQPKSKFRLIEQEVTDDGYHHVQVRISGRINYSGDKEPSYLKLMPVHILVARAFLGEHPRRSIVVHKNGNQADNAARNLAVQVISRVLYEFRYADIGIFKSRVIKEKYRRALKYKVNGHNQKYISEILDMKRESVHRLCRGFIYVKPCLDVCESVRLCLDKGMKRSEISTLLGIGIPVIKEACKALVLKPAEYDRSVVTFVNSLEEYYEKNIGTFYKVPFEYLKKLRQASCEHLLMRAECLPEVRERRNEEALQTILGLTD